LVKESESAAKAQRISIRYLAIKHPRIQNVSRAEDQDQKHISRARRRSNWSSRNQFARAKKIGDLWRVPSLHSREDHAERVRVDARALASARLFRFDRNWSWYWFQTDFCSSSETGEWLSLCRRNHQLRVADRQWIDLRYLVLINIIFILHIQDAGSLINWITCDWFQDKLLPHR